MRVVWGNGPPDGVRRLRAGSEARAAEGKRKPPVPELGRKAASFRGTTQIRALGRALEAPVTEGGPAVSPRRLPGEPNGASRRGLQPAALPLLARRDRYFPVHCGFVVLPIIYSTGVGEMQEGSFRYFSRARMGKTARSGKRRPVKLFLDLRPAPDTIIYPKEAVRTKRGGKA